MVVERRRRAGMPAGEELSGAADSPYRILFKRSAEKDVLRLDSSVRQRVRSAIHDRLAADPSHGKRLSGARDEETGRSLWSLRVGDYRVVYVFSDSEVWVLVVRVGHRTRVYHDL